MCIADARYSAVALVVLQVTDMSSEVLLGHFWLCACACSPFDSCIPLRA